MGDRQWHGGERPIFRGGMARKRHENLHGGTKATCSVACLEWVRRIMDPRAATKSLRKPMRLPCETVAAKEARNGPTLPRKAPRLSMRIWQRLQCGLSGNSVPRSETAWRLLSRETALMATGSSEWGNPTEPKPQGLFVVSPPSFDNLPTVESWAFLPYCEFCAAQRSLPWQS